jgi:molybdopterin-containing oxidoreductase family iron-sulfur binding subunit
MTIRPAANDAAELAGFRSRLEGASGPRYWRCLEELAGAPEFRDYLAREFPSQAEEWTDPASRRRFLRLMGASLALAGVSGCAFQPPEAIVPYVRQPEEIIPGKPLYFATAVTRGGYAAGVLVESHMGRPTKIEGNPDHPASLGATDPFTQAAMLELYDPDRSQVVTHNGRVSTWNDLLGVLANARPKWLAAGGAGLRILTGAVTSPTLARQLDALLARMPDAVWHVHEPAGRDAAHAGSLLAFDEGVDALHHLDRADVIVALDSDFLTRGPDSVRAARHFAARREPGQGAVNRLYAAECTPTVTGAMADHRLPVPAGRVATVAHALAHALGLDGAPAVSTSSDAEARWVAAAARDLAAHKGTGLVLAGDDQPAEVHALAHALNGALGNVGKTVEYIPAVEHQPANAEQGGTLAELVRDMAGGRVETLVIIGTNPVYDAPADLGVVGALAKVPLSIHLGLYDDETAQQCEWHAPGAHPLESWGDARAYDGTATIQQPLIAPLFGGKTAAELLAALLGETTTSPREIVRETWRSRHEGDDFEAFWRASVHDGVVGGTTAQARAVTLRPLTEILAAGAAAPGATQGLELVFRPDPTTFDGRYANNGWLQELPKPISKLTWDNAALVSPRTAGELQVANEDVIELEYQGRKVEVAVWIAPGHADGAVTLHLGYGRTRAGQVGTGAGVSAYLLRTSDAPGGGPGLKVRKTGGTYLLATTQHHNVMEGRDLIRVVTLADFEKGETGAQHAHHPEMSLFESPEPQRVREEDGVGNAWGMVINLNTCIGCGTCTIACVAENNIPVVGKDQVRRGREMHWIRVDRYYEGPAEDPTKTLHQPVPCMHCETAPCELVCPVAATTHSAEGLNEMTYNRCVGTRYCGNNCPYKVRRFNFLQYTDPKAPSLKLLANPDVTIRTRGVMEKCTYCVQRINGARIAAEKEGRDQVRYGEVATACQQACPTQAITFGNLNDKAGLVWKQRDNKQRHYALLAELNTRPRTTYLSKLTNPNPEIEAS